MSYALRFLHQDINVSLDAINQTHLRANNSL